MNRPASPATHSDPSLARDTPAVRLSEVIAAMSAALDITEGQPPGHAARTCCIGMRLADEVQLSAGDRAALFYALLLKDLGCSSNSAKVAYLFGSDDRSVKRDFKTVNWQRAVGKLGFLARNASPHAHPWERLMRLAALAIHGPRESRQLVKIRCERGAQIARKLGFPEATALAIRELDEHWDGRGHPRGLRGEEISLPGRICGLAQTVEVFFTKHDLRTACRVAKDRSGRWFDPQLVDALRRVQIDQPFWRQLATSDPQMAVAEYEPAETFQRVTDDDLDRVALAFADLIDAKSPWTYRHSTAVAEVCVGIGQSLGFDQATLRQVRRAGLLHDLGKLGVSNLILDKPARPTDEEFAVIKRHPEYSEQILARTECFAPIASLAGTHHERLDGRGYPRGIRSGELSLAARVLTVADVFEALTAARPYRAAMPQAEVLALLERDAGVAICPTAYRGLTDWLRHHTFFSRVDDQLESLEKLQAELSNCSTAGCGATA